MTFWGDSVARIKSTEVFPMPVGPMRKTWSDPLRTASKACACSGQVNSAFSSFLNALSLVKLEGWGQMVGGLHREGLEEGEEKMSSGLSVEMVRLTVEGIPFCTDFTSSTMPSIWCTSWIICLRRTWTDS